MNDEDLALLFTSPELGTESLSAGEMRTCYTHKGGYGSTRLGLDGSDVVVKHVMSWDPERASASGTFGKTSWSLEIEPDLGWRANVSIGGVPLVSCITGPKRPNH